MSAKIEAIDRAVNRCGLRDEYITSKLELLDCGELLILRKRFWRRWKMEDRELSTRSQGDSDVKALVDNAHRLTRTVKLATDQYLQLCDEEKDYRS